MVCDIRGLPAVPDIFVNSVQHPVAPFPEPPKGMAIRMKDIKISGPKMILSDFKKKIIHIAL
jgi:hypothetical protein